MNAKAEKKERSHQAIVEAAGRLLRERGIAGARVADVMGAAGLTVGGFYAHFASKEALVDDALRRTSQSLREKLFRGLEDKPAPEGALAAVKRYLSAVHRDDPAGGCPFPAVAAEIGTSAPEHRDVLAGELASFAELLGSMLTGESSAAKRQKALGAIAVMVGGLSLARAVRGTPLSDEILRAARAFAARALTPADHED